MLQREPVARQHSISSWGFASIPFQGASFSAFSAYRAFEDWQLDNLAFLAFGTQATLCAVGLSNIWHYIRHVVTGRFVRRSFTNEISN